MMRYLLFVYVLMLLTTKPVSAQKVEEGKHAPQTSMTSGDADKFLVGYEQRFVLMDSLIFNGEVPQAEIIPENNFATADRVKEVDDAVDARIEAYKAKTGLEISGQAYARPGSGIGYDPEDPYSAYFAKGQVELQWHVFQSSFYKRALHIMELKLQGELEQMAFEKEAMVQTITDQKMASRRKHDAVLMGLLRYHSENLDLLTRTQTYLLQNGKISSDDLLKLLNDKAEIDRQLTSITSDTTMHEQITAPNVVYFDTDSASLMQHIEQSHLDLQQLETEMELSDCRRRAIDFWQTLVITPFARYAVYLRPSLRQSHNLDLGVSFRIPLSYEVQKKRRVLEKEKEVLAHRREVICEQMRREVRLILAELRSYNQNIHGEYERMKELRAYLKMRTNSYENRLGEYNRLSRLQEYNAYLASWERLVNYEFQRDTKLIDLQSYVMDQPISNFVKFVSLK